MKVRKSNWSPRTAVRLCVAAFLVCLPAWLPAQVLLTGTGAVGKVRLHTSDMAVFMAREERNDLPCSVSPNKPVLGFDLRFHSTYEVIVPLRELAGEHDLLSVLFRVTPAHQKREPVYFTQRIRVPPIEEGARGDAFLHGTFDVGEGDYTVGWLMRDRAGRVCSSFWDVKAKLEDKDRGMRLDIRPGEIRSTEVEQFGEEPPVIRTRDADRLNVKVLVNFAPQNQQSATLQPFDTSALVAILRTISREPRIGKFSIVAFNLHEQRVLYRAENVDRIDFPALGKSLDTLELGTIDLERLSEKYGETAFLAGLIQDELLTDQEPDAMIFAGPKAMLDRQVPDDALEGLGKLPYPIFYMNYNLYPQEIPWRDTIGNAVRFLDGQEYTISRPRDLWRAVSDMVSQIVKDKNSRQLAVAASE